MLQMRLLTLEIMQGTQKLLQRVKPNPFTSVTLGHEQKVLLGWIQKHSKARTLLLNVASPHKDTFPLSPPSRRYLH